MIAEEIFVITWKIMDYEMCQSHSIVPRHYENTDITTSCSQHFTKQGLAVPYISVTGEASGCSDVNLTRSLKLTLSEHDIR